MYLYSCFFICLFWINNLGGVLLIVDEKDCFICNRTFSLDENLSGLVFDDKYFLCEECTSKYSDEDSLDLSESPLSEEKGMPISLWLLHQSNKDKDFMSIKFED